MKIRVYLICFIALITVSASLKAQEPLQTRIHERQIKTLQVRTSNVMLSDPIIELGSESCIEINFDSLEPDIERYAYKLIHCDADWTPSSLSTIEYMDGFQGCAIEDFANSSGTSTQYTNYQIHLPNDEMSLKVSGNYAVQVYPEDNPENIVLTACFSVYEPKVAITASVSGKTNIDTYQSHQQLNFTVNTSNFPISYPQDDLRIWVYQNDRRDNAVTGLTPMSIMKNRIDYANDIKLIFPAGNEFRRFESLSEKYNGIHVKSTSFHRPYYHIELMTDLKRSNTPYQYDQDQNGRSLIRCSDSFNPDIEADYHIVHFTLAMDHIPDGNVYLVSDIYNKTLNENSKMSYNHESGRYEKSELLKQGSHNYQYLFVRDGDNKGETAPVEGDFFQAENEYTIFIYYRPLGARYDRLIGVGKTTSMNPTL